MVSACTQQQQLSNLNRPAVPVPLVREHKAEKCARVGVGWENLLSKLRLGSSKAEDGRKSLSPAICIDTEKTFEALWLQKEAVLCKDLHRKYHVNPETAVCMS